MHATDKSAFAKMQHIRRSLGRPTCNLLQRLQHTNAEPPQPPSPTATTSAPPQRSATTSKLVDEFLRVDHAGELGADRIYAGQMAVLGGTSVGPTIRHMWQQEQEHRREFERLIGEYRVRPTVMTPLWHVAGFALGAGTALLGPKAAMACTVAVETVIVEHYNDQLRQLMEEPTVDKVCGDLLSYVCVGSCASHLD